MWEPPLFPLRTERHPSSSLPAPSSARPCACHWCKMPGFPAAAPGIHFIALHRPKIALVGVSPVTQQVGLQGAQTLMWVFPVHAICTALVRYSWAVSTPEGEVWLGQKMQGLDVPKLGGGQRCHVPGSGCNPSPRAGLGCSVRGHKGHCWGTQACAGLPTALQGWGGGDEMCRPEPPGLPP